MLRTIVLSLMSFSSILTAVQVAGELTQILDVTPGQEVTASVVLVNPNEEGERVQLQLEDYATQLNGASSNPALGTLPRSNGLWITLPSNEVVLPPKENGYVYRMNIKVPKDIEPGSYWSMLRVQPAVKPIPGKITQIAAYAIQIICRVGPQPKGTVELLKVRDEKAQHEQQSDMSTITFDMRNTSSIDMSLASRLEIYDTSSNLVQKVEGMRARLYPGSEMSYVFTVKSLQPGRYLLLGVFDDGNENLFGIQKEYEITK